MNFRPKFHFQICIFCIIVTLHLPNHYNPVDIMVLKRQAVIQERPIDGKRPLRTICVGAGISGIVTAIRFPQRIPNLDLQIYEKNSDITGTWFENRYPGCACGMSTLFGFLCLI
jgi:hypothetical protein